MQQKRWFIISYDVVHPARLRRVHRLLKAEATALLESLFIYKGTLNSVAALQNALAREIDAGEDDLLIYPIRTEHPLQRWGTACLPEGIHDFTLPPLVEYREQKIIML